MVCRIALDWVTGPRHYYTRYFINYLRYASFNIFIPCFYLQMLSHVDVVSNCLSISFLILVAPFKTGGKHYINVSWWKSFRSHFSVERSRDDKATRSIWLYERMDIVGPTRREARYLGAHILTSIKPRHCLDCSPPTVSYLLHTSPIQANYYNTHLEICSYDPSNSRGWHFLFRAVVRFLDWLPARKFRQFSLVVTTHLNGVYIIYLVGVFCKMLMRLAVWPTGFANE